MITKVLKRAKALAVTWQTIELPLNEFYPSFRGYRLDLPNFESDLIAQFSFLIANNYNADFRLEIDSIQLQ